MQPVRCSASIADHIKAKFSVSTLYTMIYLAFRDFRFAHDNFKMIDQSFYIIINLFFGGQIKLRHIGMLGSFGQLIHRLFNNAQALPHLFLPHHIAVVHISIFSYRNDKIKILIG